MRYRPTPDLYQKVLARIEQEKIVAKTKRSIVFSLVLLCFSAIGFMFAVKLFYNQADQSGFFDFLKLASTNIRAVSYDFNDFMISLVESLPVISLGVTLTLSLIFIFSARAFKNSLNNSKLITRI